MRAPASGLRAGVPGAQRHQARHLLLGEADLLAAELGEREVLHLERQARRGGGNRLGGLAHEHPPWIADPSSVYPDAEISARDRASQAPARG